MLIAISADHAGYALKSAIILAFQDRHRFLDLGIENAGSRCDYPDQADQLAQAMGHDSQIDYGILICGSGIGIAIAGNRHRHLRVALCHSRASSELARRHNDANVIALGARLLEESEALECVDIFLNTAFEGGRHLARVRKLY